MLEKYDGKITKTARKLGIKVQTLTDWKQKKESGKPLLILPYKNIVDPNTQDDMMERLLTYGKDWKNYP